MTKKILAIALSVLMIISVMPFALAATTEVASAEDFATAYANAAAGDTIKLTGDITFDASVIIDKKININLNGNNITTTAPDYANPVFVITETGNLTMSSTGSYAPSVDLVNNTVSLTAGKVSTTKRVFKNSGILTINGGIYEGDDVVAVMAGSTTNVKSGWVKGFDGAIFTNAAATGAKINVSGGVITSEDNAAIMTNGNATCNGNTITVSGGTILASMDAADAAKGYMAMAIYHPSNNTLNITGGTIKTVDGCGVIARGGSVNITGGTIIATGNTSGRCGDSLTYPTSNAVVVDARANYPTVDTLDVKIGTGANLQADIATIGLFDSETITAKDRLTVTGGEFSDDVSELLADGCSYFTIPDGSGEKVIVTADTLAVYKNASGVWKPVDVAKNGVTYAIACAAVDTTVYALKDSLEENYQAWLRKGGTITVDLQGHSVVNAAGSETATTSKPTIQLGSSAAPGSLVIKSSKAATFTAAYGISSSVSNCNLTVDKNVTLKTTNSDYSAFINSGAANCAITVNGKVVNEKEGGVALYVNGACGANNVINMNGTLTADGAGIYAAGNATYNIAGSITAGTGIYQKGGNLAITKGTITANGAKAAYAANGSGFAPTGDALAIEKASGYTLGTVAISGTATLKSTNNKALAVYPADAAVDVSLAAGTTYKIGNDKDDVSAYYDNDALIQDDNGKLIAKDTVAAEVTSATNGKVTYVTSTTAQLQIKAETVKLLKDFNATNFITNIFAGQDAVLDLNGHTFTSTATNRSGFVVRPNTKLVIKNSAENEAYINIPVDADVQGELVLEDGVTLNGNIAYFGSATLTIDGTVIGSDDTFAISSNNTQASGTTLNITKNAVITSADGIAIYHPEAGTVNISGGTITGKTALYAKRGDINISGGTFNGTGDNTGYAATGNGANATGDAVVFDNMQGYAGTLSATITGGDFNSANAKAVASYATGLDPVTGFLGMSGDATFSSDVTELCATGYKAELDGTKYIVVEIDVAGATNGAELEVAGDIEINTYFDADVYVQEFNLTPATAELRVTYNAKSDIDRNPEYVTEVYNLATEAEQVDESQVSDAAFAQTYKNSNIIAPAQITEEVVVGLYASSEATIPVKEVHYSVYKMMRNIIENAASYDAELVAYAQATIDYGKAAQNYFGYRAADLASVAYSEAAIAAPSVAALDSTFGRPAANLPYDLQAKGVSLTIKSQVEVNVTTAANFVIGEVSDGAAADFAEVNGKRCLVITDITAANTLKSINVGVNDSTLTISALNICRSIIGGNNSANYKSLAMALAFYGQAAAAYYATQQA